MTAPKMQPNIVRLLRDHGAMTPDYAAWMLSLSGNVRQEFDEAVQDLIEQRVIMRVKKKIAVPSWDVATEFLKGKRGLSREKLGDRMYRKALDEKAAKKAPDPLLLMCAQIASL